MKINLVGQNNISNLQFSAKRPKEAFSRPAINNSAQVHDGFDDGKISQKSKFDNFLKGIISPVTTLISSPKNLAIGAGAIIATGALCAALPPLVPVMCAFGLVTGGIQIAKGAKAAAIAKTDAQAEKAWESLGVGTFSSVTSLIGAKGSLKAAGVDSSKINTLQAAKECFKSAPKNIKRSFSMIKNKTSMESLKTLVKKSVVNTDAIDLAKLKKAGFGEEKLAEIKAYSEIIHKEGLVSLEVCKKQLKSILPEDMVNSLNYRAKGPASIRNKLINKIVDSKEINSIDQARSSVRDLIGFNIAIEDVNDAKIDLMVDHLCKALKNKEIRFSEIENYRGSTTKPYFKDSHLDSLRKALSAADNTQPGQITEWNIANKVKPSGYTGAQMNIVFKDGSLGEFQIRGKEMHNFANTEHIAYDLSKGKDISGGNSLLKKLYSPIEEAADKLSKKGKEDYGKYRAALYEYHRNNELKTGNLKKPKIKEFIPSEPSEVLKTKSTSKKELNKVLDILDMDTIEKYHSEGGWLGKLPKISILGSLKKGFINHLVLKQQDDKMV